MEHGHWRHSAHRMGKHFPMETDTRHFTMGTDADEASRGREFGSAPADEIEAIVRERPDRALREFLRDRFRRPEMPNLGIACSIVADREPVAGVRAAMR